jgi:hypothetical protein
MSDLSPAPNSKEKSYRALTWDSDHKFDRVQICTDILKMYLTTNLSLYAVCHAKPGWPSHNTLMEWVAESAEIAQMIARARETKADCLAEQVVEISDDTSEDYFETSKGERYPNPTAVQRSRARMDSRKWLAAKFMPRVYGDQPPDQSQAANITVVAAFAIPSNGRDGVIESKAIPSQSSDQRQRPKDSNTVKFDNGPPAVADLFDQPTTDDSGR